jgi:hypothetical protein
LPDQAELNRKRQLTGSQTTDEVMGPKPEAGFHKCQAHSWSLNYTGLCGKELDQQQIEAASNIQLA